MLKNIRPKSAWVISLLTMQFGTLPHELTTKSTELFAKEVILYFRGKADTQPTKQTKA